MAAREAAETRVVLEGRGEEIKIPDILVMGTARAVEADLEEYRAANEHDKATIRQQVTEVKQTDSTADAITGESGPRNDSITPMKRLIQVGKQDVMANVTASVERAKAIAAHFDGWASRTPKGLVVKDNLKSLLQTATGERLAWK